MANYSCNSCEDLRNTSPNFVVHGITDTECTSLQNDTGLNPSSGHNDCTDLNNINDCLVGNMAEEVEAYDVCDWKTYMKKFVPNLWTTLKSIICAICGIWTNIHNLWNLANRIDCVVDYVTKGASFRFTEYTEGTKSYIVAGKGVSFANVHGSGTANDIQITYVAGGMAYLTGSGLFYSSNFTDEIAIANYDQDGINPTTSRNRLGNSKWDIDGYLGAGGELMYEIRIKKSEFPQIQRLWNGVGVAGAGGTYRVSVTFRNEGSYAPGQHGWCDSQNGDPVGSHSSRGHLVPSGWMYIQIRLNSLEDFNTGGSQYTPICVVPIRMNTDEIDC